MKLKICGMKYPDNIKAISDLAVDYLGFIFYRHSKRFVDDTKLVSTLANINPEIQKVGVFVNEHPKKVVEICQQYGLQYAQLHGDESPDDVASIKHSNVKVIKVFHVDSDFQISETSPYLGLTDLLLFDTKCAYYGGSGQTFDWHRLEDYADETPFFLSGGIGAQELSAIKRWGHPKLFGVDVNSKAEISPALKNPLIVNQIAQKLSQ